jgi:AraC-like DNA-binding protein/tetratricopeptide (TPR) repeat protein
MKIFISLLFLAVSVSLFSQNTKIDSLEQKLTQAKGTDRIFVLNDLAYAYGYVDFNKSISLAKEALLLAEKQEYNKSKALTYDILGRAYFISGNYKVAEEYYNNCISTANKYGTKDDIYKALRHKILLYANGFITDTTEVREVFEQYISMTIKKNKYTDFTESLQIFIWVYQSQPSQSSFIKEYLKDLKKRTKGDTEFLALIYASEAFFYEKKLDYFRAIQKYDEASKLTNDIAIKISRLERIGVIYFEVKKYNQSVHYYDEALQLLKNNKCETKNNLMYLIEADLGATYLQLKDYKTALYYLQTALKSPSFTNRDKGAILNNIGVAYLLEDSLEKSDFYINKAISILDAVNDADAKLAFLNSKAELLIKQNKQTQLSDVINEISVLVNNIQDYYIVCDSHKLLSDFYEKMGNYKKSNEYLKKWIVANDSISNREFINKMSEFQFKYETEKKEQQIIMQQSTIRQKDKLIVLSLVAGSLILAALLVIFTLYRIRNKAYKLLVYQSLKNTSNAELVKIDADDHPDEENTNEIRYTSSALDEGLKNQIEILLNKQLELKVFGQSDLTLKILSERCNTNRTYLSQFINERYHTNFNTFINTLRVNEAKLILSDINNDIPLKELYLRLGFNTYSVFNEAFKKNVGVTPHFYQKTVKDLIGASN